MNSSAASKNEPARPGTKSNAPSGNAGNVNTTDNPSERRHPSNMLAPERKEPPPRLRFSNTSLPDTRADQEGKIAIEFIPQPPLKPDIKTRHPMKNTPVQPARLAPRPSISSATNLEHRSPSGASFADLMLHPEKIDAFLKSGPVQIPAHNSPVQQPAAKTGNTTAARPAASSRPRKSAGKKAVFRLQGHAKSVQIAGDFTNWGKAPVDMVSTGDGQWSVTIPLKPGQYSYRLSWMANGVTIPIARIAWPTPSAVKIP
jgi:hypothetical protein